MKAAVLHRPNDLRLEDIDVPSTGPTEMLLKVTACALCGTDTRIYRGTKTKGIHYPSVIGHEIAGVVEVCGDQVEGFEAGDAVTVCPVISCGICYACRRGMDNICLNRTAIGYEYAGGFQEYVRIPESALRRGNVFKAPPDRSLETLALIEPLACCYNGNRRSHIQIGDTVVIMGAGPIGLMHLQLARQSGAGRIVVSELLAERRKRALGMGADLVVNPREEDLSSIVLQQTGGIGADAVILAIGVPDLLNQAFAMTRKQGHVNLFAGFGGRGQSEIEANLIHYNELNVTGTASAAPRHFEEVLKLVAEGGIDLEGLITHRFALDDIQAALDVVLEGKGLKVLVRPQS